MDKLKIDDISDNLSNKTIQKILSLVFNSKKMNKVKVNKDFVRTIIYKYIYYKHIGW